MRYTRIHTPHTVMGIKSLNEIHSNLHSAYPSWYQNTSLSEMHSNLHSTYTSRVSKHCSLNMRYDSALYMLIMRVSQHFSQWDTDRVYKWNHWQWDSHHWKRSVDSRVAFWESQASAINRVIQWTSKLPRKHRYLFIARNSSQQLLPPSKPSVERCLGRGSLSFFLGLQNRLNVG